MIPTSQRRVATFIPSLLCILHMTHGENGVSLQELKDEVARIVGAATTSMLEAIEELKEEIQSFKAHIEQHKADCSGE